MGLSRVRRPGRKGLCRGRPTPAASAPLSLQTFRVSAGRGGSSRRRGGYRTLRFQAQARVSVWPPGSRPERSRSRRTGRLAPGTGAANSMNSVTTRIFPPISHVACRRYLRSTLAGLRAAGYARFRLLSRRHGRDCPACQALDGPLFHVDAPPPFPPAGCTCACGCRLVVVVARAH